MSNRLLIAASAVALALPTLPAFAASAEEVSPSPDRKICRAMELTGSRVPKRVCLTAREWKNRHGIEFIIAKPKAEDIVLERPVAGAS